MTSTDEPLFRIFFSLDAPPTDQRLFEATLDLASYLQAELHALFVEDVNLLRLAELPFAMEIGSPSCVRRPLSLESMERTLKSMSDSLRRTMEDVAQRAGVPWSFQVLRGPVLRATLDFASDADLLIISRRSLSPTQSRRAISAAPLSQTGSVLVVYDGSRASQRALQIASRLCRERPTEIIVLLSPRQPADEPFLRETAANSLRRQSPGAKIHPTPISSTAELIAATREYRGWLLLITWDEVFGKESELELLVNHTNCLVGLLRGDSPEV